MPNGFEIAGNMLAGLGLFFVGIRMLTDRLRQMTGRRFRLLLMRYTKIPLISVAGGALLGATMQTGSAITFILVGMVGAGMISVERSLPVRLGAAIGTSTMVFVATLNIETLILFIIGVGGVTVTQVRSPRPLVGALLGGGLMFFGLKMLGTAAGSLTELTWFSSVIENVNGLPLAAFLVGALLSLLVQSPQSVSILAIAMTSSGILDSWTTIAIIYGGNFGGGISTYLLSSGFRGTSRQIMIFQVLFNVLTGTVLMIFYFAEYRFGVPLIHAFISKLSSNVASQMAFVYLIFNVFGAVMMYTLRVPILGWIEHRWPPSPEEDIGKLKYLHDAVIDTPDLALDLAEKEQRRFFSLLQGHIEALRQKSPEDRNQAERTSQTLIRLHEAIGEMFAELNDSQLDAFSSEKLISLINRHQLLGTLQSSLSDFTSSVLIAKGSKRLDQLTTSVIEATDALLLIAMDALETCDPSDLSDVFEATHDRSSQMLNIRKRFMQGDETVPHEDRLALTGLTNGLERTIWVLHEFIGDVLRTQAKNETGNS